MPLDRNLYELFEAQAAATPDALAVIESAASSTSYRALDERARRIARELSERGIEAEQPIGVLMARTSDLVAVLLAVLRSGGAYVPIDLDDPPLRQQRILRQAGCRIVIVDRSLTASLRSSLSESGVACIDVDALRESGVAAESRCAPGGSRLAYILFTSGSTGEPKGVEVEHRSVENLLLASRNLLGFAASDCTLAASTIGFDISVVEIFLPLITGGRLLLRDRKCWLDPAALADDIRMFGVTVVQCGPSTWSVLVSEAADFPRLRVVISTAEAIGVDLARRLVDLGDDAWNLYGPTETTVWSTAFRMTHDTLGHLQHSDLSVSIGHPLLNTSLCIIDSQGTPVAVGERGELCIGGLGVARGYRGSPELTEQKFLRLGSPPQRFYRTGDVAAWSADGELLYFGRLDDQMKIRGHRVDPGEVESSILMHPTVRKAAATWFETATGGRSIIAAIVLSDGATTSERELYGWLETRLPSAMIPSRFVFCLDLPATPSGKVDRVAIRRLAAEPLAPQGAMSRPLSSTEEALAVIWRRVLEVPSIAPESHFFTIGGDSLAAVRVLTQVEVDLGVDLPVQALFEAPTLRAFAARVDRAHRRSRAVEAWQALKSRLRGFLRRPAAPSEPSLQGESAILAQLRIYVAPWRGRRLSHDSLVVTLNERGTRAGLFWCLQGQREFEQLAAHLGADIPIHGMRSGHLVLDYDRADDVAALAQTYADEIEAVQPSGPLHLGGNCQGGIVMHAVAQRLRQRDREVRLLILMEQRFVRPFPGKVALVFGRESHLNPYLEPDANPEAAFREAYPGGFEVEFIHGAHGGFFESPNIEGLAAVLQKLLPDQAR